MNELDLLGIALIWSLGVWTGWLVRDVFRKATLTISYRGRVIYERRLE